MAAPDTQKTDQAPKPNAPSASGAAPTPGGRTPAPKRGGGWVLARLLLSAILLLVALGVAGYGALIFRDSDPRIGAAADYVDQGVAEAQGAVGKAQRMIADLAGSGAPKPAIEPEKPAAAPTEPEPPQTAAATPAPAAPAAPTWEAPAAKEPEKPAETKAAPPAPEKPVEEAKPVETVKPVETAKPIEAAKTVEPAKPVESVKAPEPVAAAAPATEFRDADGFTAHELISALEGRIEALNDEVQALRQKLDAPKNETRAAPEAAVDAQKAQNAQSAAPADVTGAEIALAFALQRDLDAGRPFAAEIAGFSKLGTTPAPGPALVQFAETGAPTAAKLHEEFVAIAKKLRAGESHATAQDAGALADHILQGASKLVKVRPTTGAAEPESFHGKLDRIEHALAHGDFATADSLFESLPEAAREEAATFGKTLHQRLEAARAVEELLNSAIAALGKK